MRTFFTFLLCLLFPCHFLTAQTTVYNDGILTILAGDFYVNGDYINESANVSTILNGDFYLTGHFENNVTLGNLFTNSTGTIHFMGSELQRIYGTADKVASFINFPNVEVNNPASVQLDYQM